MCVIAFSPKGVDIPSEQQIKQMWYQNPDGAGYAYVNKKGKVVYRKGFMTLAELMAELQAPERFKNTNFALHFRIGTSGKNDKATCHPFPISNEFRELRKTEGEVDSVLFHNGILSKGGVVSPLASDTQDFVVAMYPMFKKYNKSKARDFFIEELITGSKLLVLYKNNKFKMYGQWEKDGDVWVSNLHYKYSYDWHGSGYYDWREYDDDYYTAMPSTATGATRVSKFRVVNNSNDISEEAKKLWTSIITKEYMFLEYDQIEMLKRSAEEYTQNTMELDGYVLGYDLSQGLVWLEETPIILDQEDYEDYEEQEEEQQLLEAFSQKQ